MVVSHQAEILFNENSAYLLSYDFFIASCSVFLYLVPVKLGHFFDGAVEERGGVRGEGVGGTSLHFAL